MAETDLIRQDTRPEAPAEWSLPATPENVSAMRRAVTGYLIERDVPTELVNAVRAAVSEAVTNVVLHAYLDQGTPGPVHLLAQVDDEEVCVTISDRGRGMVPRYDSPGAGLGLLVIAQLAASVEIGHEQPGGTRLRMTFDA